ncbi:Presumed capsid scaffolding protein (GpO) [Klebsiella michiganensis]|uniref:Presumed capsid scaffolding protein (GpO) n=1 Tax=Klebsiella michiganensis TaxID=1134687 RepID=A0A7H4LS21_9ENTR|nr:Presumed capsid scaffolding protein (GpO) [Klebsiella michiganensis]
MINKSTYRKVELSQCRKKYRIGSAFCAAGQSVLGEPIKEEVIQEAADNYDTSFYTAMIWPNHPWPEVGGYLAREMYTYNLGRVVEMKAEREGGVLKLFARYAPNQFLINLNNDGQRLFSSAEFDLDFQGEGKNLYDGRHRDGYSRQHTYANDAIFSGK